MKPREIVLRDLLIAEGYCEVDPDSDTNELRLTQEWADFVTGDNEAKE